MVHCTSGASNKVNPLARSDLTSLFLKVSLQINRQKVCDVLTFSRLSY